MTIAFNLFQLNAITGENTTVIIHNGLIFNNVAFQKRGRLWNKYDKLFNRY